MRTALVNHWKGKKFPAWGWGLLALGGLLLSMGLATPAETPVFAGNGATDGAANAPGITPPAELGFSALDVLLKLGFVIGLIYVSLYLLRRWSQMSGKASRQLHVLESLALSPRQTLHLVRVGSQTLLIGATDQALASLGTVELPLDPLPDPEKPTPPFSTLLTQALTPAISPLKVSHDPES